MCTYGNKLMHFLFTNFKLILSCLLSCSRLVELEQDLKTVASTQGTNMSDIIKLVNENEEILSAMRVNLTQMFVAAMAQVVMRSDSTYYHLQQGL